MIQIEKAYTNYYSVNATDNKLHLFKVIIEGWVIADEPLLGVEIKTGNSALKQAKTGIHRPDIGILHPTAPNADHSGFRATITHLAFRTNDPIEITAEAKTVTGKTFAAKSLIELIDRNVETETDPIGNGLIEAGRGEPDTGPSPLRLHLEKATIQSNGLLEVVGWVAALNPLICVQIFSGEDCLGNAQLGIERRDVHDAFPEYPNSLHAGFIFTKKLSASLLESLQSIRAHAVSKGSIFRSSVLPVTSQPGYPDEPTADLSAAENDIHFHCDDLCLTDSGRFSITGWAFSLAGLSGLDIHLGGAAVGSICPNNERLDVGNAYPHVPTARASGFSFEAQVESPGGGEHPVKVVAIDKSGQTQSFELAVGVSASIGEAGAPGNSVIQASGLDTFRLELDEPSMSNGRVRETIRGRFTVAGWALAREDVASVDAYIDDVHVGQAYYGIRRHDIEAAFPEWKNSLLSGYALAIPAKLLQNGEHVLRVSVQDTKGQKRDITAIMEVAKEDNVEDLMPLRHKVSHAETATELDILAAARFTPSFHLVMPLTGRKGHRERLLATLRTLENQTYGNWRIILLPYRLKGGIHTADELIRSLPGELAARIDVCPTGDHSAFARRLPLQEPVAESHIVRRNRKKAPAAVRLAPAYIGFLEAGDELACDALLKMALANVGQAPADFLYGDERRVSPVSGAMEPFLKPQWSPDLLWSTNYIGRAWVASSELFAAAGLKTGDFLRRGHYDLVLRLTERAGCIRHVPGILVQRGLASGDSADRERKALERALKRRRIRGAVLDGCVAGTYRTRRDLVKPGKISIIIPTIAARGLVKTCLDSIREKSTYRDFEFVCLDNIRNDPESPWKSWLRENADQVVEIDEDFNWSRFNNLGAAHATGDYLLFLNDDIEVIEPSWLEALLECAQRPDVGVVGPRLLYPDGKVQHAGLFLSGPGLARHAFRFAAADDPGYFGLALTQRNMIGVTGACMLMSRGVFETVGGFNEAHSVINNDLDFCLRCHRHGFRVVYTPHTSLYHHELVSRAKMRDVFDMSAFLEEWGVLFMEGDPYFHRDLAPQFDDYSIETEPLREVYAGHPIARQDDIKRILAVKLDHIGDFVTAIPAFRRLKERFPSASLSVLAGRSAAPLATLEPAIDQVFDFEFFHARSGLGYKEVTEDDLKALEQRLAPYRFDLAIDLRKLYDTRPVLNYTGARYLAGFDQDNRFPWLDFALEWEGDPLYQGKRMHVATDLLNLVDAVANACGEDRTVIRGHIAKPPQDLPASVASLADVLFSRPVVCVHPASGNELRQWPPAYFGELINLLVTRLGVHVVIIGGPDEAEIASQVLEAVKHPESVWPLVGTFKLSGLPDVIAACALFVGNNSGPKHLAAGLGVPTVAVHSGVVASEEWGPLGPDAVAIRRDMSCSPCYRGKMIDCHRSAACLTQISPGEVFNLCRRFLILRSI
jgi:ADP-heptose:LPS heptosyltransferase/GT2 family glycosyltransferase